MKERTEETDFPRTVLTITEINAIMGNEEIAHMPYGIARDMASSMVKIANKTDLVKIAGIMTSMNGKLKIESCESYEKDVLAKYITVAAGLIDMDDIEDQNLINPIRHLCGYFRQLFLLNLSSTVYLDNGK